MAPSPLWLLIMGSIPISDYKKITMVQIINGRLYYLGTYGNKFIDITDDYSRFIINGQVA
jgi:hypothetical protein